MSRSLLGAAALGISAAVSLAATPTPTPPPRLSGGFGRPRTTPSAASAAGGQSLADVVRAAHETRDPSPGPEREKAGVTINNRSLVTNPEKGRVSTSKITPPPRPTPVHARNAESAPAAAPAAGAPEGGVPTEEEWRGIARRTRTRVQEARARIQELDAVVHKLENDFYAWDDGQYRDRVIKPSWDRARADLEDAKRELSDAEKDLSDLPEKARKAGALPGWIRE